MNAETKQNCDAWVKYAYENWLEWVRKARPADEYYLRESTRILVGRMKKASTDKADNETWNLLERLKKLGTSIKGMQDDFGGNRFLYEQAEINLECAVIAYNLGDDREATALLDLTSGNFASRSIHKAVSYWIAGCIQWKSQSHFDLALVSWERSSGIMKELAESLSVDQAFAARCATIMTEMNGAIRISSQQGYPPPPPPNPAAEPASASSASRPGQASDSPPKKTNKPVGISPAYVKTYPILGSIPAGAPVEFVNNDSSEKTVSNDFEINGQVYKLYNLGVGLEISIIPNLTYFLLKVTGDSMNNAKPVNIEEDDYVFMVKQDTATGGDIIAAQIENDGPEATLKRYYFKDGKPALRAESRSLENNNLPLDKPFSIRGKAIAVLKCDE